MADNRVFYASHNIKLTKRGATCPTSNTYSDPIDLIQSVGINANRNVEPVFELGRFELYENLEGIPVAEITIERYMTRASVGAIWRAGGNSVENMGQALFNVDMAITDPEGCNALSASGFMNAYNMSATSYSLNFGTDGPATESITLNGNNIGWTSGISTGVRFSNDDTGFTPGSYNNGASGVIDRSDVFYSYGYAVQSASFTVALDREDVLLLGHSDPYMKPLNYPVVSTAEISEIAISKKNTGYGVGFGGGGARGFEEGNNVQLWVQPLPGQAETTAQYIYMPKASLISTSYSGGDASGGNATITNTYENYNSFSIRTSASLIPGRGNIGD